MVPRIPQSSFPDLRLAATHTHDGRHLPRWEAANAVYHVALHLADSVPASQRRIWQETRDQLQQKIKNDNRSLSDDERLMLKAVYEERVERFLAAGYGECLLRNRIAQQSIREILSFGNTMHYALHVWCVMPNHLHVIVGSFADTQGLSRTLTNWKRISGHAINKALNRQGPVWHADAFTRIIRNVEEYKQQLLYVWRNPETAGLSSDFARECYVPNLCA